MTNEISKNIRYIGVDDLDIDLFESQYIVPEGMSYNSWVILDDKVAVMDTADGRKEKEWTANLVAALEGRTPDYLVCQHMEPDHSAIVGKMMQDYPTLTLVCSQQTVKMLAHYFDSASFADRIQVVKEGDSLSLGTHTLHFIAAPMVHWPEVIMTYESSEKILFAADGFGKFGALCNETDDWACEARRYYFNIVGKYGMQVQNVLKKASTLEISAIMPLHGPVLQGEAMAEALRLYDLWSRYEPESDGILMPMPAYTATRHRWHAIWRGAEAEGCRKGGGQRPEPRRHGRGHRGRLPLSTCRMPCLLLRCRSVPPDARFPAPPADKSIPAPPLRPCGKRHLAPTAAKVMRHMIESMKQCEIVEPTVTIWGKLKETDKPALEALADAMLAE